MPDRDGVRPARVDDAPVARAVVADGVQRGVQLAQRGDRQVDELVSTPRSTVAAIRPAPGPSCTRGPAPAPTARRPRRPAAPRSRGTRTPSPPSRPSRPSPPACRRSGRAARRSRRSCRRRTCRSRRGPRGSPRAPPRASRPRAGARSGSRRRPRCRCRSGTRCPRARSRRRRSLWLESEPLCTRHRSRPVENGCECSVVTRLSVAIRVWPSAWLPCMSASAKRSMNSRGGPASL